MSSVLFLLLNLSLNLNLSHAAQYIRDEVIPPGITRDNEINPTGTANAICLSSTPGPTFNIAFCSTVDLTAKTVLYKIPEYTVATLPASHPLAIVTDAANASTCTTGGGSTKNVCWWNGSIWVSLSGSGGGGGLPDPGSNGIVIRSALGATIARSIGGTAGRITITNPTGVGGDPTINTGTDVAHVNTANTFISDQIFNTALIVPRKNSLGTIQNGEVYVDGEFLRYKSNTGILYTLLTIGGTNTFTGENIFQNNFALDDVTPGTVTSDQNNYAGCAGKVVCRLLADGRSLTGMTDGADGRIKFLINIGSSNFTLRHENSSSSAANRFLNVPATDIQVPARATAFAWYDATSSRWRVYLLSDQTGGSSSDTLAQVCARGCTVATAVDGSSALKVGNGTIHILLFCDSSNVCRIKLDQPADWVTEIPTGKNFTIQNATPTQHFNIQANGDLTRLLSGTQAQGDIIYFDGTKWVRLPAGTSGQFLKTNGAGANPAWTGSSARVKRGSNQSINDSTDTPINFDAEDYDTDTMHDNSTNNTRMTFTTSGKYSVKCNVLWASNATGYRLIGIVLNATTTIALNSQSAVNGIETGQGVATDYNFSASDYIECNVKQTSGGNLNVLNFAGQSPTFTAHKID